MILAVGTSQTSDKAMKSPKEDILSEPARHVLVIKVWMNVSKRLNLWRGDDVPLALAYAVARGLRSLIMSFTMHTLASSSLNGTPTAAPETHQTSLYTTKQTLRRVSQVISYDSERNISLMSVVKFIKWPEVLGFKQRQKWPIEPLCGVRVCGTCFHFFYCIYSRKRNHTFCVAVRDYTAPAGLTCLNEVAAGIPRALFNSLTSCQAFRASHRLMKPGDPLTTGRERQTEEHQACAHGVVDLSLWCVLHLSVEEPSVTCRAERALDAGSCRSAGAAGKSLGCILVWSSRRWPRRTEQCVWRPETELNTTIYKWDSHEISFLKCQTWGLKTFVSRNFLI